MTTIQNHSEYVSLVNTLKVYDYQYFTLNAPTITDAEYDRLYFMAQDYEQRTGDVLADSPTQTAHAEYANGHRQIARRTPMLSTEKAQTIDKVQKWMKATSKKLSNLSPLTSNLHYTVEWKYDGVSCSLIYQDGQLIEASYGKGIEGNDCLALCKQVKSIPNEISAEGRVEVRGEMVVPFANLSKTGYKNCRSAAAGIIADTQTTMAHCLEFYPYHINLENRGDYEELTTTESLLTLSDLGFNWSIIDPIGIDRIADYINGMEKIRYEQTFPTDGLVIKVKDRSQWDSLGQTAHHPKYAIAYKFAAATAETTITRIEITTGATGKRTPVAYFEPIIINGATYQKASVGSEAKLAELGIEVGSRVIVSLRNDVIPHIDGRVEEKPTLEEDALDQEPTQAIQVGGVLDTTDTEEGQQTTDEDENAEPQITQPADVTFSSTPSPTPSPTPCPIGTSESLPIVTSKPRNLETAKPRNLETAKPRNTVTSKPRNTVTSKPRKPSKPKHFRMADETVEQYKQRILRETGELPTSLTPDPSPKGEGSNSTTNKIIAGVICAVLLVGVGVLAFAGLGAVVFFAPLLAGAFKS